MARKRVATLINQLALENPKIPSNMLHALQSIRPSQLMDQSAWNFKELEKELLTGQLTEDESLFSPDELELEVPLDE